MNNPEVIAKAAVCVAQSRKLMDRLDRAPVYVRAMPEAKAARQNAEAALELIGELVQRVKAEESAEGVTDGDAE